MKEIRYVFSLGMSAAIFFIFTSHVIAKIFGHDFGNEPSFIWSSGIGGFFFGVFLVALKDLDRHA